MYQFRDGDVILLLFEIEPISILIYLFCILYFLGRFMLALGEIVALSWVVEHSLLGEDNLFRGFTDSYMYY